MKTLVVYYSRTGTTKKVAQDISKILKCDKEEIQDIKSRKGVIGYLISGREAMTKKLAEIKETKKDPSKYDLVIIGTPVWAYNMSSPVRTYITKNKFKKIAFFCTMGGSGDKPTFKKMEELCNKKPKATLTLKTKEVMDNKHIEKLKEFLKSLK